MKDAPFHHAIYLKSSGYVLNFRSFTHPVEMAAKIIHGNRFVSGYVVINPSDVAAYKPLD